MRFRLFGHRRLAGDRLGEVGEQAQMVGKDLRAETDRISCGDGRIGPDFQGQLIIVCHVAHARVFHGVVHLVNRRVDGIDGDRADGQVGCLVLVGRDVSAPMVHGDLHVEGGIGTQRADVQIRIEDLHFSIGLDVACSDLLLADRFNINGLFAL